MKTKFLTGLVLLATAACSGAQTTGGEQGEQNIAQLKKAAAEAQASGSAEGDVCGRNAWYGDGECDSFCQDADSVDCVPNQSDVVCALFVEEANGYCSRVPNDPCIAQDPDCRGQTDPSRPDDPIACTLIAQLPDGICNPAPNDPCAVLQDPDCSGGGSGSTPGYPGDSPRAPTDPGDSPGKPEPTDPIEPADPSLPIACAEYIELSDGVCKRAAADPCIFQDPDCSAK